MTIVEMIAVLGLGLTGLAGWFLLPYVVRRYQERAWRKVCRDNGVIVLTFDDGPGERLTGRLLQLLAERSIPAGFFLIGNRASENPDTVQGIRKAGHDIGSHTRRHLNAWKSLPTAHCPDMLQGHWQVSRLVGDTRLFRPPYGKMSLASFVIARLKGWKIAWWTVDARDSLEAPRSHDEVLADIRRDGGGVVLLHDYDHFPDPDHEVYVIELVKKIDRLAREKGLRFVSFSQFLRLAER